LILDWADMVMKTSKPLINAPDTRNKLSKADTNASIPRILPNNGAFSNLGINLNKP